MRIAARRARRSAVVAFLSILTLLATALPAFAHHSNVSGSVECLADGSYKITWRVENPRSWSPGGSPHGAGAMTAEHGRLRGSQRVILR